MELKQTGYWIDESPSIKSESEDDIIKLLMNDRIPDSFKTPCGKHPEWGQDFDIQRQYYVTYIVEGNTHVWSDMDGIDENNVDIDVDPICDCPEIMMSEKEDKFRIVDFKENDFKIEDWKKDHYKKCRELECLHEVKPWERPRPSNEMKITQFMGK